MEKFKGEIGRNGDMIYYQVGNEVYRAHKENAIDCDTGYLIGRWECSINHFEVYRITVYSFVV